MELTNPIQFTYISNANLYILYLIELSQIVYAYYSPKLPNQKMSNFACTPNLIRSVAVLYFYKDQMCKKKAHLI